MHGRSSARVQYGALISLLLEKFNGPRVTTCSTRLRQMQRCMGRTSSSRKTDRHPRGCLSSRKPHCGLPRGARGPCILVEQNHLLRFICSSRASVLATRRISESAMLADVLRCNGKRNSFGHRGILSPAAFLVGRREEAIGKRIRRRGKWRITCRERKERNCEDRGNNRNNTSRSISVRLHWGRPVRVDRMER